MLNSLPECPFSTVAEIGVALKKSNIADLLHVGLLYQTDTETRLLHLTAENAIDQIPSDDYIWVQCGLGTINRKIMAAFCVDVAEKLVGGMCVPYGFAFAGQYFTVSGAFIGDPIKSGLTCSTFILALFRTLGFELVKTDEWPAASVQDKVFQERMTVLFGLKSSPVATALVDQWGSPRYRPEHVIAAAHTAIWPVGYREADRMGKRIMRDFKKVRPV